jgi:hypothetical protein
MAGLFCVRRPRCFSVRLRFVAFAVGLILPAEMFGQGVFRRGDSNEDGVVEVSDAIRTLFCLFVGAEYCPQCADAMDADDDGTVNGITDAVFTLRYLFISNPPQPPPPDPGPNYLWLDPTDDGLTCRNGTGVIGEEGGTVEGPDGVVLTVPAGAFGEPTLVLVVKIEGNELPPLPEVGLQLLAAVVVGIGLNEGEEVAGLAALPNQPLGLAVPVDGVSDGNGVLAQAILYDDDQVMEAVAAVGVGQGVATTGEAFPGVLTSGLYAVYGTDGSLASGGVVWADGEPVRGAMVSNDANGLVAITDQAGGYTAPARAHETMVTIFDRLTGRVVRAGAGEQVVFSCPRVSSSLVGLVNGSFEDGCCTDPGPPPPNGDPWPMARQNAQQTAQGLFRGPSRPLVRWQYELPLSGQFGEGLELDGTSSYVEIQGDPRVLNLESQATFETWVKLRQVREGVIANKEDHINHHDPNGVEDKFLGISSEGKVQFWLEPAGGVTSQHWLAAGVWYHVAGTYDGEVFRIYLNGELDAEVPRTGVPEVVDGPYWMQIGGKGRTWPPIWWPPIDGWLDELRIWRVSRSQAEIQLAMNGELAGNEAGLLALWHFNELDGGLAADATGRGNDGRRSQPNWKAIGQPLVAADGRVYVVGAGQLLEFDPAGRPLNPLDLRQFYPCWFSSTPVIVGGTIYLAFNDGRICSYDRTSHNIEEIARAAGYEIHGLIQQDSKLFCMVGQPGWDRGRLVCLNLSGENIWNTWGEEVLFYQAVVGRNGNTYSYGNGVGFVSGVWAFDPLGGVVCKTPTSRPGMSLVADQLGNVYSGGHFSCGGLSCSADGIFKHLPTCGNPVLAAWSIYGGAPAMSEDGKLVVLESFPWWPPSTVRWINTLPGGLGGGYYDLHGEGQPQTFPILDADNRIYLGFQDDLLRCLEIDPGTGELRERWRYPVRASSSGAIGGSGTLYVGDTRGVLYAFSDCSEEPDRGIPGWRVICGGKVVESFGPADRRIEPKYGRYMAQVPIYAGGDAPHLLLEQTFSGPLPAEAKCLRFDVKVLTDAEDPFADPAQNFIEVRLKREEDGFTLPGKLELSKTNLLEEEMSSFPEWPGTRAPRQTTWLSTGLDDVALAPFRGQKCDLSVYGQVASGTAVALFDGFRFGKVRVNGVIIEGAADYSKLQNHIVVANRIFQQSGVAVELLPCTRQDCIEKDKNNLLQIDNEDETDELFRLGSTTTRVNVFYVQSDHTHTKNPSWCWPPCACGNRPACGDDKKIVVTSGVNDNVLAHELGHSLLLSHVVGFNLACNLIYYGVISECGGDETNIMYYIAKDYSRGLTHDQAVQILQSPDLIKE